VVRLHKELVYADRDFMVFNKPYNLHCTTDRTNHQRSIEKYANDVKKLVYGPEEFGQRHPYIPLRLPKNVTGCTIIAKTKGIVNDVLLEMAKNQLIGRVYLVIVIGKPGQQTGIIDIPIGESKVQSFSLNRKIERSVLKPVKPDGTYFGQRAVTHFHTIAYSAETNTTLLQVQPLTNAKDQVLVHLADGLGTPVLGDHKHTSDFKARGGMDEKYIKRWYKMSMSQPLPVNICNRMNLKNFIHGAKIPLHMHLHKMYIPGFAPERSVFDGKSFKSRKEEFVVNDSNDLICKSDIPKFWHETLRMLSLVKPEQITTRMVNPRPPLIFTHSGNENIREFNYKLTAADHIEKYKNKVMFTVHRHKKKTTATGLVSADKLLF